MRKVLVLGGHGFIGSTLVNVLLEAGTAVRILDLRCAPAIPLLAPVEFIEGDFTNALLTRKTLEGVDSAVHLASITTPQSGTSDPEADVSVNLLGAIRLLRACDDTGVRRVVFLSSGGTIYGTPDRIPIPEDHPERPINSYGIVKLTIEKYLAMFRHLGRLDPVVLRPANPYGPGQRVNGIQGAVAVAMGCLRDRRPFRLWGDGSVVRDFFFVEDLARAILLALDTPATGPHVFNLGSGEGTSLLRLLGACERASGRQLAIERLPARAIDIPVNVLDCASARTHLGWVPRVRLEEGLERTWRWISSGEHC